MSTVAISKTEHGWVATAGPGQVGEVRVRLRPDDRCLVWFAPDSSPSAIADLFAAVVSAHPQDLITEVPDTDATLLANLTAAGFVERRREHVYEVDGEAALAALADQNIGLEWTILTAEQVDRDRLRESDDLLRQDTPGVSGWRWNREDFLAEMAPPAFDPQLYRVLVDESGEYQGICRIWPNPQRPRIGFVGVTRRHRRTGLATAPLADTLRAARRAGLSTLTLEADVENVSNRLAAKIGARRVGGTVELVHRRG